MVAVVVLTESNEFLSGATGATNQVNERKRGVNQSHKFEVTGVDFYDPCCSGIMTGTGLK